MADEGKFRRWQAVTIAQLGYAINLIFTFSTATLGFELTLVMHGDLAKSCFSRWLSFSSCLALTTSIGLGVWCVVNRLSDFRKTARIARCREKPRPTLAKLEATVKRLQLEVRKLGERTWTLFWWQVGTFAAGVLLLLLSFLNVYHTKFF